MPSYTITTTSEKAAKILAALDALFAGDDDYDSLTDRQKYLQWLKGKHIELAFKHARRVVQGTVAPDNDIVDVT